MRYTPGLSIIFVKIMTKMRRVFLSLVLSTAILGCNSADKRIDDGTTTGSTEAKASNSEESANVNSSHKTTKITAEEFKQKVFDYGKNKQWVFAGDKPCIVDFYADWCGPCKMLSPILEKVAKQYDGKINVYKINIDEQPEVAQMFGISSIPALLLCPMSNPPQMTRGFMQEDELKRAVEEIVLK